ncbi:MAG TPA: DUF4912 domain-containing protein [Verrucomicrobiota bacterium]|nr:DUF4912 domain-containing protein [Verrucomicrobiota bacterium]
MKAAKSFTRAKRAPARSLRTSRTTVKRRRAVASKSSPKSATRSKRVAKPARTTASVARSPKTRRTSKPAAVRKKRTVIRSKTPLRPRKTFVRRNPALKLPPILLEGDHPEMPQISGPGIKYALGPTAPAHHFDNETAELPATYGTKRLSLIPRDPHWFHAHWDLPRTQQARYNKLSADRHLVLRVYADEAKGAPVSENHVHPESRHWFAHVEQAGANYIAELGYYRQRADKRTWTRVAISQPTSTPPEHASSDASFSQATIPAEIPLPKLAAMTAKAVAGRRLPLAKALEYIKSHGGPNFPAFGTTVESPSVWTRSQRDAMAEYTGTGQALLDAASSVNITELIRSKIEGVLGVVQPPAGLPTSPGAVSIPSSPSSPFGGLPPAQRSFWFNINAELVVYGATEPDANVTVGGRPVKLRPDGTFSFRFSLPDGQYELPVVAVSADGTEGCGAELKFSRSTELRGDVGVHPQDAALKPPSPEFV